MTCAGEPVRVHHTSVGGPTVRNGHSPAACVFGDGGGIRWLFIPNILSGACLGRAIGEALDRSGYNVHPGVYALVGATGMLSGQHY